MGKLITWPLSASFQSFPLEKKNTGPLKIYFMLVKEFVTFNPKIRGLPEGPQGKRDGLNQPHFHRKLFCGESAKLRYEPLILKPVLFLFFEIFFLRNCFFLSYTKTA